MLGTIKKEQQRRKKIFDNYKMGVRVHTKRIGIDLTKSNTRSSTSRTNRLSELPQILTIFRWLKRKDDQYSSYEDKSW